MGTEEIKTVTKLEADLVQKMTSHFAGDLKVKIVDFRYCRPSDKLDGRIKKTDVIARCRLEDPPHDFVLIFSKPKSLLAEQDHEPGIAAIIFQFTYPTLGIDIDDKILMDINNKVDESISDMDIDPLWGNTNDGIFLQDDEIVIKIYDYDPATALNHYAKIFDIVDSTVKKMLKKYTRK